jgi:hypothetical protein
MTEKTYNCVLANLVNGIDDPRIAITRFAIAHNYYPHEFERLKLLFWPPERLTDVQSLAVAAFIEANGDGMRDIHGMMWMIARDGTAIAGFCGFGIGQAPLGTVTWLCVPASADRPRICRALLDATRAVLQANQFTSMRIESPLDVELMQTLARSGFQVLPPEPQIVLPGIKGALPWSTVTDMCEKLTPEQLHVALTAMNGGDASPAVQAQVQLGARATAFLAHADMRTLAEFEREFGAVIVSDNGERSVWLHRELK